MKVICVTENEKIPSEIKGLVKHIQNRNGDCECMRNKNTWFGNPFSCGTLFCSYGAIGYDIDYKGWNIHVDNELDEITIE